MRLSPEAVRDILARVDRGESMRSLAIEYGVSHVAIQKRVNRARYKARLASEPLTHEQQIKAARLLARLVRREMSLPEALRELRGPL